MTIPAVKVSAQASGDIMESILIKGDLSKLSAQERSLYYMEVCRSVGLNPLTKPFEYLTLNGKLTLYALRACTDQLRKINGISLEIVSRDVSDDILTVHVRARHADGRTDEDLGTVSFPPSLKGEARANAELKAVTKAKRRATLSICGLGWLDETEIEDIPASAKKPPKPAPNVMVDPPQAPPHDPDTGEIIEEIPTSQNYINKWNKMFDRAWAAHHGDIMSKLWEKEKHVRNLVEWSAGELDGLEKNFSDTIDRLKRDNHRDTTTE